MNVIFVWDLPTINGSGLSQDIGKIQHTEITTSVDGGSNWAVVDRVAPDVEQTARQENVADGDWLAWATCVGTNGKRGVPAEVSYKIDSAPGTPQNFVVAFE